MKSTENHPHKIPKSQIDKRVQRDNALLKNPFPQILKNMETKIVAASGAPPALGKPI
jgi:hypothetical protein